MFWDVSESLSYSLVGLWKVICISDNISSSHAIAITSKLLQYIATAAQNLLNPKFNHYLFEALVSVVKHSQVEARNSLQSAVAPVLQTILVQDIAGK